MNNCPTFFFFHHSLNLYFAFFSFILAFHIFKGLLSFLPSIYLMTFFFHSIIFFFFLVFFLCTFIITPFLGGHFLKFCLLFIIDCSFKHFFFVSIFRLCETRSLKSFSFSSQYFKRSSLA